MIVKDEKVVFDNYNEYLNFQHIANHENNYTGSTNRPWINEDLDVLMKYIVNKDSRILSIGTRDFYDLRYLKDNGYWNLVGCDIDTRSIDLAKKFNFDFKICDIHKIEDLKFNIKIDAVYCRHVLEHCYDVDLAIKNILKIVKDDAYIMLVVPLENSINISKNRGHCRFWTIVEEFSNFCKQFMSELECTEDAVSRKKPQVRFLGKKLKEFYNNE